MPPLDDADKTAIEKMIADTLKGETFAKTVGDAVTSGLGALKIEDKISTTVDAAVKKAAPEPDKGDDKGKDKDKGGKGTDDKVAQKFAAMEAKLEAEKKAREDAEAARRTDSLHSSARAALIDADVPGDRVKHAMAFLRQEGLLESDEDGKPSMKAPDQWGNDALQPLKEAIPAWLKTDDGKAYLPPKGVQGTGDGAGKVSIKGPDGADDLDKVRDAASAKVLQAVRLL